MLVSKKLTSLFCFLLCIQTTVSQEHRLLDYHDFMPTWNKIFEHFEHSLDNKLDANEDCAADIDFIRQELVSMDHNPWLLFNNSVAKMLDATAKVIPGIARGAITMYGNPRECKSIKGTLPHRHRAFDADYCRINVQMPGYQCSSDVKTAYKNPMFAYDVCIPKSCTQDIEKILSKHIKNHTRICSVICMEEESRIGLQGRIVIGIILTLAIVSLFGTIVDYCIVHDKPGFLTPTNFWIQCTTCFSLYTNVKEIFHAKNKPGQIAVFNGLRFFSIAWVVLGHAFAVKGQFSDNVLDVHLSSTDFNMIPVANGFFSVDTFFFISGFLTGFIFFKSVTKSRKMAFNPTTWIMYYVHRIVRLSPPYYLVIAFYAWVMPEILRTSVTAFPYNPIDSCHKYWWTNFLYINNLVHYDDQCYLSSWYLATDFQIYVCAPIILIALAWSTLAGYILSTVLTSLSFIAHYYTVVKYHMPPSDMPEYLLPKDPEFTVPFSQYTFLIYDAAWIRFPVYLIGILLGHYLQTRDKIRISRVVNIAGFVVSFSTMLFVIYFMKGYGYQGEVMPIHTRALYSVFSKPAWALALSWIVFTAHQGCGGFVADFLSWNIWMPAGKLAYSTYLLHMSVITFHVGNKERRVAFSGFQHTILHDFLPIFLTSMLLAIPMCAILEIGVGKLEMKLLGLDRRKPQEGEELEDGVKTKRF